MVTTRAMDLLVLDLRLDDAKYTHWNQLKKEQFLQRLKSTLRERYSLSSADTCFFETHVCVNCPWCKVHGIFFCK